MMAMVSGKLVTNVVPCALGALDIHLAAQFLHGLLHHVHPDAAARDVGDLLGCREAGQQDETIDFLVRQGIRRVDEPVLDGLLADLFPVEAPPVVGNLEDDVAAPVKGPELDGAPLGLACLDSVLGHLHPVVHGIADHVDERVVDLVDHVAVDFGIFSHGENVDELP